MRAVAIVAALFMMAATSCGRTPGLFRHSVQMRLLYWNIQNGMWSGQVDNYDAFVSWVKAADPDICVWCEAQSIYKTGTNKRLADDQKYLVKNWSELAARYGHSYIYVAAQRDNYPQVITSRYPVENVERIAGAEPDSVVTHGAGWVKIKVKGREINVVCLHTWPQKFAYRAKDEAQSKAENGGDKYRRMEIEYICRHTIGTVPDASRQFWMMMGDFNSVNRTDNSLYGYPDDDTRFLVQDYIRDNTPYLDVIKMKYPEQSIISTIDKNRIDYVYCTRPLYDKVVDASIVKDAYTTPVWNQDTGFCIPSDHLPIMVDFRF